MNSPGITKREPITGAARFRGVLGVMRPASFRGVVEQGFGDRLGSHWGLKGERPPRPAPRDFRRRGNLLGPLRWPRQPPVAPGHYSIYSTLRLALALRSGVHALASLPAQTAAQPVSYHFTLSAAGPRPARERAVTELRSREGGRFVSEQLLREGARLVSTQLLREGGRFVTELRLREGGRLFTERFLRELWAAFRLPSQIVLDDRRRDLRAQTPTVGFRPRDLPFEITGAARPAAAQVGRAPRAPAAATAFARLPGVSRSHLRFFNERLFSSSLRRGDHTRVETGAGSRTFVLRHSVHGLGETALRTLLLRDVISPALAGESVASGQSPPARLDAARPRLASSPAASPFTAIQLTLSMQKPDDAGAPTPAASRFGSSPPLQYARQAAQLPRELAAGLRELRQSIRDNGKAAAAPAPAAVQIDHLTRQVYDQLKRELRIEKERRGL